MQQLPMFFGILSLACVVSGKMIDLEHLHKVIQAESCAKGEQPLESMKACSVFMKDTCTGPKFTPDLQAACTKYVALMQAKPGSYEVISYHVSSENDLQGEEEPKTEIKEAKKQETTDEKQEKNGEKKTEQKDEKTEEKKDEKTEEKKDEKTEAKKAEKDEKKEEQKDEKSDGEDLAAAPASATHADVPFEAKAFDTDGEKKKPCDKKEEKPETENAHYDNLPPIKSEDGTI